MLDWHYSSQKQYGRTYVNLLAFHTKPFCYKINPSKKTMALNFYAYCISPHNFTETKLIDSATHLVKLKGSLL